MGSFIRKSLDPRASFALPQVFGHRPSLQSLKKIFSAENLSQHLGFHLLEDGNSAETREAALPFLAFFGIAVVAHAAAGWGIYRYLLDKPRDPKTWEYVEWGQEMLRKWKANPNEKFDYWYYFLMSENPGKDEKALEPSAINLLLKMRSWDRATEKILDPQAKMKALDRSMYFDFFQHYARDYPQLTNLVKYRKGNCVARTKLILSIMTKKVPLSPNEGFGVQKYKRHIAPVYFKKDQEGKVIEVRDLVTGKVKHEVVAPIYQAIALVAASIKAAGAKPAISVEELLIEAPAPGMSQKVAHPFAGVDVKNSGLDLPDTDAEYDGDAPEDAYSPPPDWEKEDPDHSNSASGKIVVAPQSAQDPTFENLTVSERADADRLGFDFWPHMEFKKGTDFGFIKYHFRNAEDGEHFYHAASESERYKFLMSLERVSLERRSPDSMVQNAIRLFSMPGEFSKKISESELQDLEEWMVDLFRIQDEIRKAAPIDPSRPSEEEKIYWKDFMGMNPEWENLEGSLQKFRDEFTKDPQNFLLLLNQESSRQKRQDLFHVFSEAFALGNTKDADRSFQKLGEIISNPEWVGEAAGKPQTPYRPITSEMEFIDVDMFGIYQDKTPDLKTPAASEPENPQAKILISRDLLVEMIIRFHGVPGVESRWKDEYAKIFFTPTSEGFEQKFLNFSRMYILKNFPGNIPRDPDSKLALEDIPNLPPNMKLALEKIQERSGGRLNMRLESMDFDPKDAGGEAEQP